MTERYRQVNLLYLLTIGVVFVANFIPLGRLFPNDAALMVISQIIIVSPSAIYLYSSRQNYVQAVNLKKVTGSNVALLIFFAFCMSNVMTFINAFSRIFAKNVITETISSATNQNPFLISLICIAVVPAIFEESVYRGIFYQEYRKVNPLGAIFLSALLFGLLHGNLNQFSYAFCMGIIFALVVEATDSIASTMILHFIINGSSVVLLYVLPRLLKNYDELLTETANSINFTLPFVLRSYGLSAIIFGVAGFFIFRQIAKNCDRWEHIKGIFKTKGEVPFWKLFTPALIASIIILVAIMVANEVM